MNYITFYTHVTINKCVSTVICVFYIEGIGFYHLPLHLGRSEAVIEDFKLNMATPNSSHMVGRCFVATETGTYFDGTGFLKAGEMRH